jgi:hypothetical protein
LTEGAILELREDVLHALVDSSNSRLGKTCSQTLPPAIAQESCRFVNKGQYFRPSAATVAVHMWTHTVRPSSRSFTRSIFYLFLFSPAFLLSFVSTWGGTYSAEPTTRSCTRLSRRRCRPPWPVARALSPTDGASKLFLTCRPKRVLHTKFRLLPRVVVGAVPHSSSFSRLQYSSKAGVCLTPLNGSQVA